MVKSNRISQKKSENAKKTNEIQWRKIKANKNVKYNKIIDCVMGSICKVISIMCQCVSIVEISFMKLR